MALLPKKAAPKKAEKNIFWSHWLFTVYLALVSFVAIVVMSVNLWVLMTSLGKYVIVSESEYLLSNKAWEIRQCSEPLYEKDEKIEKSAEEIKSCEEKAKVSALAHRSINLKEKAIESLAWFAVFALLFWFHYPKFLATRKEK